MKLYVFSTAGVVVVAGLAALGIVGGTAGTKPESPFIQHCEKSLERAAAWAFEIAERSGKDVSVIKRAKTSFNISSACRCAERELAADVGNGDLQVAGKLAGLTYKMSLARRAKDMQVQRQAQSAIKEEIDDMVQEHQVSMGDIGRLSRQLDSALKGCFRK